MQFTIIENEVKMYVKRVKITNSKNNLLNLTNSAN